ncbi:amino acid adenylation domain-containing protein, partial [Xenorhabdus sp. 12]|nr:amino acid adenylation domain-containing protein [Xenorhabdus sp. 12]
MSRTDMNLENLKLAVLKKKIKEQLQAQKHHKRPPIEQTARDLPLPLSFAQQRLWFLNQLDPAAGLAYHIPAALRLTGRLNHDALLHALNGLVARHEILRTRFILIDGQPHQCIEPADSGFALSCHDLRPLEDAHAEHIAELTALEAQTPFDLTHGPLIRGQLLQLADEEHVLLLNQHHIISDGWSIGVLVHELGALYRATLAGLDNPLPPLPVQYVDYAVWQRHWLQGDVLTKQRDFWHSQLAGAPALLDLPTDRPRPAVQSYTGAQVPVRFDAALLTALKSFGQQHNATLFMTILTAWSIALARLSGQNDIVIGTPIANRPHHELEGLIGFFVNTLALRVTLSDNSTVSDLLTQIRERTLSAYAHQDLPFEQVVETLQPERSLSYSPIFQVMLALNNTPAKTLTLPGLQLSPVEPVRNKTHFDLTLSLTETDAGLFGELEYAVDLFDAATIERMLSYLHQILLAMTRDVSQPVYKLPMLSAAERQQLLVEFNATQADFPHDALIHQLFEAQAAQTPEATAIVCKRPDSAGETQSLSYDTLNQQANRLAHHLVALGVNPDDRVAICVERNLEMVIGLLAILKAGGAYVPLDPAYPAERLAYMLEDSAPVILLTQRQFADKLSSSVTTLLIDDIAENRGSFIEAQPADNLDAGKRGLTSQHLAYVIYTSGSTGLPKGVAIAHHNTVNFLIWARQTFNRETLANTLFATSFNFDLAVYECFAPLISGGTVHIVPDALSLITPESLPEAAHAISLINTVPSAIAHLLESGAIPPSVRTINLAGEALKPHIVERLFANTAVQHICNLYGPSETTTYSTWTCMEKAGGFVNHIGRPIANTRVYILDPHGQPVPLGVAGEIFIAGAGVARGYLNRPELTAERFLADPFLSEFNPREFSTQKVNAMMYKTGDLGRWLPNGNIEYLGRNDFQVKLRGFRIELGEIETQLMRCPGVREAVVLAREDSRCSHDVYDENAADEKSRLSQKRLVAYLRPQEGIELLPAQLREQLARHLAEYMLPSAFVILDVFPLTPNGKLDRQAFPDPEFSSVIAREYAPPVGEVETALVQTWQDLLGLEQISRHDHFFELGGHSLMIVSLIERLHHLGWRLDVRSVFAAPVLSELAKTIAGSQDSTQAFAVPPNLIPADCTAITPDMLPLVSLTQSEINAIVETIPGGASNVQDIYPLAPLQEGIIFHHLLQSQGDDYLLQSLLAFDTSDRLDSFLTALQQIIDRHDILRTSAYWQELAQPVQVVWRHAPLLVNTFAPASPEDVLSQLRAYTDPRQRRINLAHAPLLAAHIAHDPVQNEWLLSLSFHHLVCDHLTLELIFAEIAQALQGNAKILPAARPYRDFIAQTLSVPASAHEDYFRARLSDVDEPTAPFGILKGNNETGAINETRQPLNPMLAKAIRSQARRLGVSPSVLFHIAWAQVLAQTSGGDDVVFGTVLLGRLQGIMGANQILGMFINTLPIRISLARHNVYEVVQATYRNLTELLEHEQAPLSLAQRCSGVAQPMPLFSALLNYRHSHVGEAGAADKVWAGMRILAAEERTNYPMTLSVDDLGTDFHLMTQTIAEIDSVRVLNYLITAISGLVDALNHAPQQSILQIPILPAAEQQQLLVDFNATQADFSPDVLVHQLFEAEVARHPADIAIMCKDQSLSYDELNRRANRLAHHLIALGVQPDDRVAMCVERSLDMAVGLLGILKAGAAYVPLDPAYPDERLTYMIEDSAPTVLLAQKAVLLNKGAEGGIFAFSESSDPGAISISLVSRESIPIVMLDDQEMVNWAALSDSEPEIPDLAAHHLAYVVYTSGSTGQPKGVMSSHRALCNRLLWFVRDIATSPLTGALKTSISFVDSLTETLGVLLTGGKLVVFDNHEAKDPTLLKAGLQRFGVNHLVVVPSLLKLLVQSHHDDNGHHLQSIDTLICSGERLAPELARQVVTDYPWIRLFNFYGSSEINGDATYYQYSNTSGVPEISVIGRPIANTQCYILDSHGNPVPLGVTGEIYIAGAGVARGYLNRPELTAERFFNDPFSTHSDARMYKTGDLGRWLPDGTIEYLGRNDFQVKLRGFRIELGEIETRLTQCQGVREAVVIAREDEPGQNRLVAYLRPMDDVKLIPAELRQQLALYLADYMLPSAFVILESFPLTPNGKLNRQALPAPDPSAVVTHSYVAPVGEIEVILSQTWQDLLGLEQVGRHDHFFELGGHSLLAIQLVARIRQALSRDLPLQTLFDKPVLMALAETLTATAITAQTIIPSADRSQPLPLSFAQQRLWFLGQFDPAASLAYHLPAALRLTGQLNHDALIHALNRLVARHESLRTRFVSIEGQPYQQIDPADSGFSLLCHDLRPLEPTQQAARVTELAELDSQSPFDFAQGPLIRGQLLQLAEEEHVLLLTQHHIITDGWSLSVLVRELGVGYSAALAGHFADHLSDSDPLPPLPVQYADYAVWQHGLLQGNFLAEQRDFWRDQLKEAPALLALPIDHPRPAVQTYTGAQVAFQLDAALLASLKELGQRHRCTLFMTVLTAWSITLARLSGQDDIVIGTPVANRPHHELEGLIGFFVNTLALRIKLHDNPSVAELLARVKGQALAAYAHQDLPFEQVVEAVQPERCLSYSPIFQVMLTLNNTPAQKLTLPGLQLTSLEQAHHGAYFDLTLALTETEMGLVGALNYAADLFDSTTINRIVGHFTNILTAMVADEIQTCNALPMLSETEQQQVLVDFNATQTDFSIERSLSLPLIHQHIETQAARHPEAIAVIFHEHTLHYGELNQRANQLAHHLIALGVRPDERVAICVERSPEM